MTDQNGAVYRPIPTYSEWYPGEFRSEAFDRYRDLLQHAKDGASASTLESAVLAATRSAAIDTGAIEGLYSVDRGFTRTIATQSASWEVAMASRGDHVRRAFEDALNAYEFVLDAATQSVIVTEVFIRELHALVCASQDTYTVYTAVGPQKHDLPKGKYKTMPNSPTLEGGHVHAYAPVADTAPEMQRLVDELRSEKFIAAHPIVQAAYAHYAYVCIHPFADGNGRVARALASIYLYRNPGIPLVIFADQRNPYFDALEAADRGNSKPFVSFIGERVVDTIGLIRSSLHYSGETQTIMDDLRELFASSSGSEEIRAAAVRLRDMTVNELTSQLATLDLPRAIESSAYASLLTGPHHVPTGYEVIGKDGALYLRIASTWPKAARVLVKINIGISTADDGRAELIVASSANDGLDVWMRELTPQATEVLMRKLTNWVEGELSRALGQFHQKLQDSK
ncbi:Fic family protein [Arthrobacter sp. 260]|uniref:Fic family protein n=1 Tax=Arthrobacter sp. 260 TaxID=2735314 RepID=UPI001492E7A0|nr:Fic family protein [Arthrobacter sp. 260]NOJ59744.1 Fic family protein [Arthrobacter sp. 260]